MPDESNHLMLLGSSARGPDVVYVSTPDYMLDVVLETGRVSSSDVVYDLGSGDGRIVIAAAVRRGARGVGVDIDPVRIAEGTANAALAGVSDRTTFMQADLFEVDLRPATVVTMYLLPGMNLRLRPKLLSELRPGARVVSHGFNMGDWPPFQTVDFEGRLLYMWIVPPDPWNPRAAPVSINRCSKPIV